MRRHIPCGLATLLLVLFSKTVLFSGTVNSQERRQENIDLVPQNAQGAVVLHSLDRVKKRLSGLIDGKEIPVSVVQLLKFAVNFLDSKKDLDRDLPIALVEFDDGQKVVTFEKLYLVAPIAQGIRVDNKVMERIVQPAAALGDVGDALEDGYAFFPFSDAIPKRSLTFTRHCATW